MQNKNLLWIVVLILLLGAGLRIIGMAWGLPYQLEPDEPVIFINAWERATAGTASFMREYPPLYPEMLSVERKIITALFGENTPQVAYFFYGRYTGVLISLLMLAVAYRAGKSLSNQYTGLAFMLFLAVEAKVALELGWIIKPDGLSWLFAIGTLWAVGVTLQKHSWKWLAASVIWGLLATVAKYNMATVFIAVGYAFWYLMVGKRKLLMWLLPVLVLVGISTTRLLLRNYWLSHIGPYMADCRLNVDLALETGVDEPPLCGALLTIQKHARPFYERDNFLNQNTLDTFEYLINQIGEIFSWWRLAIGVLLFMVWVYLARRENKQSVWMLAALISTSLLLFTLFEVQHPVRQYYISILVVGLLLAIFLGRIAEKSRVVYAGLLLLLFVPYLFPAVERRIDLRKTDTREATANYMLENAPPGAAILVEYDKVEFMSQYGGFPNFDNYFNVIPVQSIYEKDVNSLAEQGIAYVVVDARSGNRGGYYASPENFPEEKYQRVFTLDDEHYVGPERQIFRTFNPQYEVNAHFGNVATLMGYDMVVEGDTLKLTLYWQSQGENMPEYSVFVHMIYADTGEAAITKDAPPDPGTPWWTEKQWIFETREIADIPPGTYFIRLGMYDPVTGQRLPVQGSDFIELAPFQVG